MIKFLKRIITDGSKKPESSRYEHHPDECPHDWPEWSNWHIQLQGFHKPNKENLLVGTRQRRCPLCGKYGTDYREIAKLKVITDGQNNPKLENTEEIIEPQDERDRTEADGDLT